MAGGHHERYDGSGYPLGLVGTKTPLCCRLLSVVNVYDACRAERLYRPALDHEAAFEVVLDGRGTKFDPIITDVFESLSNFIKSFYLNSG
jgi:putative two-component system response regulator